MVDLITRKAWAFPDILGANPEEIPVPDGMVEEVEAMRENLVERIAETDDALATKISGRGVYFGGGAAERACGLPPSAAA